MYIARCFGSYYGTSADRKTLLKTGKVIKPSVERLDQIAMIILV